MGIPLKRGNKAAAVTKVSTKKIAPPSESESESASGSEFNSQIGSGSDAGSGSELESGSEAGSNSEVESGSEAGSNSELESGSEAGSNSELESGSEAGSGISNFDSNSELGSDSEMNSNSELGSDSEMDSEEDGSDAGSQDEDNSAADSEEDESDEEEEETIVEQAPKKKPKVSAEAAATTKVSTPSNLHETPSGQSNEFTVFVGNLPYSIEEGRLRQLFKACGTIREVRLVKDAKTKQCKGIAYIDFSSKKEHDNAIAMMHDQEVDGRQIRVDAAASTKKFTNKASRDPMPILFVGNLTYSVTEKKLQKIFGQFGTVLAVRVPTFADSKESKGYAYVQFSSTAEAKKAMEVPRFEIDGRIIRLDYDDGSFNKREGVDHKKPGFNENGRDFNKPSFGRKPFSGGDRKPFAGGDRKPFSGGDRKPFDRKSGGFSGSSRGGRSSASYGQKRKANY